MTPNPTATRYKVPFNRPHRVGTESRYIEQAFENHHLSGDGPFTQLCAEWLERWVGAPRALLTPSCTAALEMSAVLADVGPGDEVIMPSFTFVSTANAFVLRGATPVFVDVDPETLNLDPEQVRRAITSRTRAIVPVHYAGVSCDMTALGALAQEHGLLVIEDAAQGLMSRYEGRPLGSIGALSTFSFHETKNVTCGEGGALLVNDDALVERAEIIREKGTNRRAFARGEVDRYTWVDLGSSNLMGETTAAFLWAQLEWAEEITARRLAIWQAYQRRFEALEREGRARRPVIPAACEHNAHMYYLLLPSAEMRPRVIRELNAAGINVVFHYVPLHSAPAGARFGRTSGSLRVTEELSARLVRLPLFADMTEVDVALVADAVDAVLDERSGAS